MDDRSRTSLRRWSTLAALVLVATAALLSGVAAVDRSLLDVLNHPQDDVFLVAGFLVTAVLGGSLLLPTYLDPEDADSDADTCAPEATPEIPHAGADVEPLTGNPFLASRVPDDERGAIRERLRDAAVDTIRRQTGVGTDDASARVRRGDWTDDAVAAWFLGETPPPRSVRLYAGVSDELAFRHGARRTVHAVVAYERRHRDTGGHSP